MELIKLIERHIEIVKLATLVLGGGFAFYQYHKQQKLKKIQNLSFIWRKFIDSPDLLALFNVMDKEDLQNLENYDATVKFKFLALLEEAAIYSNELEIDKELASYLFKWHFKYVFIDDVKKAFWANLGGESEIDKPYWEKSKTFANTYCK